jgi:adenylate kinase family enzyme
MRGRFFFMGMTKIAENNDNVTREQFKSGPMRILVFGNSGSGKSTFARRLATRHGCKALDLDDIVWSRTEFAKFRPDEEIMRELEAFVATHSSWVIEGCYGRWMERLQPDCTEMVFLNPSEETCLAHCRARSWEPEKYPTEEEQDARLPLLLDWVHGYYSRTDDMSLATHRRIFDTFSGAKREIGVTGIL